MTPELLPEIIKNIQHHLNLHHQEITLLDQTLGDGDHLINLQRGFQNLTIHCQEWLAMDWATVFNKIGMSLMISIGGASGSLYGTLGMSLSKAFKTQPQNFQGFATAFAHAVQAVKQRGKADIGEKTLLDVWIPVANYLVTAATQQLDLKTILATLPTIATEGMEATRDQIATKGRASFLGERSIGHIDAGAKTAQLMVIAIVETISADLAKN
ncbi:MAG: hypothetical protein RL637_755 [Pseudomonadota bacterium]|jgi:dihydroxyacetone kinase-like protein